MDGEFLEFVFLDDRTPGKIASGKSEKKKGNGWGGRRFGAGRKKKKWRLGAPHTRRVSFSS